MTTRTWTLRLAVAALLAGAPLALPTFASGPEDAVVEQLRGMGYTEFQVARTLLGRIQIVAVGPQGQREIVFNPATGEILRDFTRAADGAAPTLLGDGGEAATGDGPGDDGNGNQGGNGRGQGNGNGGGSGDDHGGGQGSGNGGGNDDDDDDGGNGGHGRGGDRGGNGGGNGGGDDDEDDD